MSVGIVAVVAVAGLACPAHMWWQARRGRKPACCPTPATGDEATELQRRQQQLRSDLDALESAAAPDSPGYAVRR